MTKVLFYFGAGLSNACGLMDTKGLADDLKKHLKKQNRSLFELYKQIEDLFRDTVVDIEKVYTLLADRKDVSHFKNLSTSIYDDIYLDLSYNFKFEKQFDALQTKIERYLETRFWNVGYKFDALEQILPKRIIEEHSDDITIVTTNYDLLIENYFVNIGTYDLLNMGWERGRTLDSENFGVEGMIDMIKLHGSINFFRDSKNNVKHSTGQIKKGMRTEFGDEIESIYIHYPLEGMIEDVTDDLHSSMLFTFEERLQECEKLVFIGTTLRNTTIKDVIKDYIDSKDVVFMGKSKLFYDRFPELVGKQDIELIDGKLPDKKISERFQKIFQDL